MTKTTKHGEPHTERHEHHIHQEKGIAEWIFEGAIALMVLGTLCATSVAAYWTSQQWVTADDQERRQLRAYVGVAAGDIEDFGAPDNKQRLHLVRKNYGLTPAYDVGFSNVGTLVVTTNTLFSINTPAACKQASVAGLITMFPTVELPLKINFAGDKPIISAEDIGYIKAGTKQFVYFGDVCYHDTFGATHYTNYCYMFRGTSMTAKDADSCLVHNDSN